MAGRLDELEEKLIDKSEQLATKFGLVAGKEGKGGLRSRLLKATLTAATQYEVSVSGFNGSLDMVSLAWTCSRAKLTKHENELAYLKEKLKKLEELTTTDQTWRDVTETWYATLALLKSIEVERGVAVLQCIARAEQLLKSLGMADTLYKAAGDVPTEVVVRLNAGAGAHIRKHAYKYDKLISPELVRIRQVKQMQWKALTLVGSAFVAGQTCSPVSTSGCWSPRTWWSPSAGFWLSSSLLSWGWGYCCCCRAASAATTVAGLCSVRGGG